MSASSVSNASLSHQLQQYFQTRQSDLNHLGKALSSGDLAGAKSIYDHIVALGKNGPFGGEAFKINQREQDFNALGRALQSGNLAGAKEAFSTLKETFEPRQVNPPPTGAVPTNSPEIVVNLSNSSGTNGPEQGNSPSKSGSAAAGGISVSA